MSAVIIAAVLLVTIAAMLYASRETPVVPVESRYVDAVFRQIPDDGKPTRARKWGKPYEIEDAVFRPIGPQRAVPEGPTLSPGQTLLGADGRVYRRRATRSARKAA
jgi:hypothetical protein